MGWSIGFDSNWDRDIGYGVPAYCDHPGCTAEIDRGLAYVCGGEPYGGSRGCGLYFCGAHMYLPMRGRQRCAHCARIKGSKKPKPSPDHPDWVAHKLTDESWQQWRDENPDEVAAMKPTHPSAADKKAE